MKGSVKRNYQGICNTYFLDQMKSIFQKIFHWSEEYFKVYVEIKNVIVTDNAIVML